MQGKKTASVKTAVNRPVNGNDPDQKKTSASRVVHTPIGVKEKTEARDTLGGGNQQCGINKGMFELLKK